METSIIEKRLEQRTSVIATLPVSISQCIKQSLSLLRTEEHSESSYGKAYIEFMKSLHRFKLETDMASASEFVARAEEENYRQRTNEIEAEIKQKKRAIEQLKDLASDTRSRKRQALECRLMIQKINELQATTVSQE